MSMITETHNSISQATVELETPSVVTESLVSGSSTVYSAEIADVTVTTSLNTARVAMTDPVSFQVTLESSDDSALTLSGTQTSTTSGTGVTIAATAATDEGLSLTGTASGDAEGVQVTGSSAGDVDILLQGRTTMQGHSEVLGASDDRTLTAADSGITLIYSTVGTSATVTLPIDTSNADVDGASYTIVTSGAFTGTVILSADTGTIHGATAAEPNTIAVVAGATSVSTSTADTFIEVQGAYNGTTIDWAIVGVAMNWT